MRQLVPRDQTKAHLANSIDGSQKVKQFFIICIEELLIGESAITESSRQVPNCKYITDERERLAMLDMNMHRILLCARSNPLFLMWQDPWSLLDTL